MSQLEANSSESVVAARYADVTYRVIGAAMDVHNKLGPGLKEIAYHTALSSALREKGLGFEDEKPVQILMSDERVGLLYVDHFVEEAVVVEEKAFSHLLTNEELAQIITYLGVLGAPLGLLINFVRQRLEYKRVLPPTKFQDWAERASRYAWVPDDARRQQTVSAGYPIIRSTSADEES